MADVDTATERLSRQSKPEANPEPRPWTPSNGYRATWAKLWAVDPERGDLYAVAPVDGFAQFVQVSDGIVNRPETVKNSRMKVLCDIDGNVIGLPCEATDWFVGCTPVQCPSTDVFS